MSIGFGFWTSDSELLETWSVRDSVTGGNGREDCRANSVGVVLSGKRRAPRRSRRSGLEVGASEEKSSPELPPVEEESPPAEEEESVSRRLSSVEEDWRRRSRCCHLQSSAFFLSFPLQVLSSDFRAELLLRVRDSEGRGLRGGDEESIS
ncbi:unnamed protein product [Linum trigynum]|uniref:Uncharacterized protein n=1 Tax=Linum trigynum TaxID=586398 RepID=A0AAV2CXB8_9ROSI